MVLSGRTTKYRSPSGRATIAEDEGIVLAAAWAATMILTILDTVKKRIK
jgi:hypothetical protein